MKSKRKRKEHPKRWTAEEERTLSYQVTRNANNIKEAFRKTSTLIDRSVNGCRNHWYMVMCKRGDTAVCYTTIGYGTRNVNRKVVSSNTSDNTEKVRISWWRKVLALLKSSK